MASITEISSTTIGIGNLRIYHLLTRVAVMRSTEGQALEFRGVSSGACVILSMLPAAAWYRVAGDAEIQQARFRAAQNITCGTTGLRNLNSAGERSGARMERATY